MLELMQKYGIAKTKLTPLRPAPGKKYVGVTSLTGPGGDGRGISSKDVQALGGGASGGSSVPTLRRSSGSGLLNSKNESPDDSDPRWGR